MTRVDTHWERWNRLLASFHSAFGGRRDLLIGLEDYSSYIIHII